MTKGKIISALDIGSSKISALIGQVLTDSVTFETSINIIGAFSVQSKGVKKGQIVDIDEAVEASIAAVEGAERMAGFHFDSAYIAVGGAHISSQNSNGVVAISDPSGEVSGEDVARVIEAARAISQPASRQIIHVLPREFIVDGESGVKDPIGMTGVRLEVNTHLVTASSSALKNLAKAVNEVGVTIQGTVFSGLASSESTLSDTEKELGCVLIDVGGGVTSVAAFVDGALAYSCSIPIGAKNVTNDLAIGLRVSLETAEKIKLSLSQKSRDKEVSKSDEIEITDSGSKETKKVSRRTVIEGIIKPRLNEIFTIVRLDLEKMGIVNRIPSGAVITGGGSLTVGALESAKKTLGMPVRVAVPGGVGGLIDDVLNPAFSTVVGLINYASKQNAPVQSSSFLPSFGKKFKLPTKGIIGKLTERLKDLLP